MADDVPPPIQPDDAPPGPPIGARVLIEGELRHHGEESHWVRIQSGHGLWQYVWVRHDLIKPVEA